MYYAANSHEVAEDIHVPIRSIWMLQLYASQAYAHGNIVDRAVDAVEEELPVLVSTMLCDAVEKRFRHELSVGFTIAQRDLTRVRGRIDALTTQRHQLLEKGRISCHFNELTYNNDINRYLRHALDHATSLLRRVPSPSASAVAFRCRRLAQRFHELGIPATTTPLRPQGRLHARDLQPVNIASLLLDFAIPTSGDGTRAYHRRHFNQHELRTLFEKALLGIYTYHLTPLGWQVSGGEKLYWNTPRNPILPEMKTDIILRAPTGDITVIDAKFTSMYTVKRHSGTPSLKSAHLYQLYTYLRSQEHRGEQWAAARGVLAYASAGISTMMTEQSFEADGHNLETTAIGLSDSCQDFRSNALLVALNNWP